jgi:hypothetical protein
MNFLKQHKNQRLTAQDIEPYEGKNLAIQLEERNREHYIGIGTIALSVEKVVEIDFEKIIRVQIDHSDSSRFDSDKVMTIDKSRVHVHYRMKFEYPQATPVSRQGWKSIQTSNAIIFISDDPTNIEHVKNILSRCE